MGNLGNSRNFQKRFRLLHAGALTRPCRYPFCARFCTMLFTPDSRGTVSHCVGYEASRLHLDLTVLVTMQDAPGRKHAITMHRPLGSRLLRTEEPQIRTLLPSGAARVDRVNDFRSIHHCPQKKPEKGESCRCK